MSYEKFVTNYRRYTHCARTFDEAYKTPEYAQWLWKCETQDEKGITKLLDWLIPLIIFVAGIFVTIPTIQWIINK